MATKKCKDCGHEISTKAKACPNCGAPAGSKQYGLGALVLVIIVIVILIGVFSGNQSSTPSDASSSSEASSNDASSQIAGYQVLSKKALEAGLKDPDSAKYKDVHAYRYNLKGKNVYVFCGEIDAKNGFGGYTGYERFVATPAIAATESEMKDMDKLWDSMCSPKNEVGPVRF